MTILTLTSNNPKFSYIISKNPATIRESGKPFQRELRQGQLYGWFTGEGDQTFRLWFKDHPTRSSFAEGALGEFEYLDKTRYSSPYLPIMMVQTALATAAKVQQEFDATGYMSCRVDTTIHAPSLRHLENIARHYGDVAKIEYSSIGDNQSYINLSITGPSVFHVLNILQVVCVMQAMRDDSVHVKLDRAGVEKYLRVLNNSSAPYYVRYLFASRAIQNRSMFQGLLPQIQGIGMQMTFGDTRQQRFDAIQAQLKGGENLIDIGCGEMFYATRLSGRYGTVFAIDADEELAGINDRKVEARGIENITAVHAKVSPEFVSEASYFNGADVLATEVLEHMPEEEAGKLLEALLKSDAGKIVVTVPNANFNDNYGLGDEFRHPDHHYEPTFEDWCDYAVTIAAEHNWDVDNVPIGDIVNDQSVTTMSVFTRKKA